MVKSIAIVFEHCVCARLYCTDSKNMIKYSLRSAQSMKYVSVLGVVLQATWQYGWQTAARDSSIVGFFSKKLLRVTLLKNVMQSLKSRQ